jgi:hypothetical protein
MNTARWVLGPPELLILAGSCVFASALWLSAYLEPDIRALHFFQSWMYVAAAGLSLRRNRWGYFVGICAAGFWDYVSLFVNTFLRSGLQWLSAWIATGQLRRLDQIIAVPAWVGNFLVLVGGADQPFFECDFAAVTAALSRNDGRGPHPLGYGASSGPRWRRNGHGLAIGPASTNRR